MHFTIHITYSSKYLPMGFESKKRIGTLSTAANISLWSTLEALTHTKKKVTVLIELVKTAEIVTPAYIPTLCSCERSHVLLRVAFSALSCVEHSALQMNKLTVLSCKL